MCLRKFVGFCKQRQAALKSMQTYTPHQFAVFPIAFFFTQLAETCFFVRNAAGSGAEILPHLSFSVFRCFELCASARPAKFLAIISRLRFLVFLLCHPGTAVIQT